MSRLFEFASAELGGLDILVNNAGLGIFRPAAEMTVEEWDRQIGVNLSGAFYCSREALQRFERSRAAGSSISAAWLEKIHFPAAPATTLPNLD